MNFLQCFQEKPINNNLLDNFVNSLFEDKSIISFKGDISTVKQKQKEVPISVKRRLDRTASRAMKRLSSNLEKKMLGLYRKFNRDDISKTRFTNDTKNSLFLAYREAYELGTKAAGFDKLKSYLGSDEERWLASASKEEQKYLNSFIKDIIKGQSVSKVKQRIHNYAESLWTIFNSAKVIHLPPGVVIYWVLESDNPCKSCRQLNKWSPFTRNTLPTTPRAGDTICRSNCWCRLRTEKVSKDRIAKVEKRNKIVKDMSKRLQRIKDKGR